MRADIANIPRIRPAESGDADELRRELEECYSYLAYFQESEEKYISFFATITDAIFMHRIADGEIFEANDNAVARYGYSHRELRTMRIGDLLAPRELWTAGAFEDCVKATEPCTRLQTHYTKDGAVFPVEVISGVYHWRGTAYGYIICRDVSGRLAMERSLVSARDYSLSLFDNLPTLIRRSGTDPKCDYFNRTWLEFTGRTLERELGDGWLAGVHPDDAERCRVVQTEAFRDRLPFELEYRLLHHDGTYHWLLEHGSPFSDPDGEFAGYIVSCMDISDRRQYEEQLLESRKEWVDTFDTITDLITIHGPDHSILLANRAACQVLHLPEKPGHGTSCHDFQRCSDGHELECPLRWAAAERRPVTRTSFCASENRHYEVKVLPRIDANGDLRGFIRIAGDVTDRKRLEEELFQAQKMESIGTLAGGVAHDFNNILTVISGSAFLLEMSISPDDVLRQHVAQIIDAADRAAGLTQSLLAFSRKQNGCQSPVDLVKIVGGIQRFLSRVIGEDIALDVVTASSELIICGDKVRLEQVLLNLATNSRDAMPDGGRLTIGLGEAPGSGEGVMNERYAVLTFADTGSGIGEKERERIFDPFFTTKEPGRGTGLGLSVVYGIVRQHGGTISVESSPGQGTRFMIRFPLIPPGADTCGIPSEVAVCGNETVLLVEDDRMVRELLEKFLEHYGYRVFSAADGDGALSLYSRHGSQIDVVVMDVVMPGMSGRQTYEAMRKIDTRVKVLFMSGYTAEFLNMKSFEKENFDLITKPVMHFELARRIRSLLDGPTVHAG